ncbi:chorismate synthase [Treponema sp. TIM-1]|uniref:chorismate synthase n=1 Tax=Treponema sp. TIM-1 TaxID=2898417 RepID=UPI0039800B5A
MGGNRFGTLFTVTTFGESHGPGCGSLVDGCPAGVNLETEDIARELRRRRPGGNRAASARAEADEPEILSGIFEGKTLGTPIAILVRNKDQHSGDYDELRDLYRPGHADWTWEAKYGIRDHRGGGRSSGRETVGRVAAGAVAKAFLAGPGILIRAWTSAAAGIRAPDPEEKGFDYEETKKNPLGVPCRESAEKMLERIEALKKQGDSAGGVVTCVVTGLPPGLGDPVFDKLDARIAAAMLSIGAVKGVELGTGFTAASCLGSVHNDEPISAQAGQACPGLPPGVPFLTFKTNHAGGVLGGISTGSPLEFRVVFKPVPSIAKKQHTLDRWNAAQDLVIRGRHDVCIVPRAIPVVEAMTALVLADLVLLNRCARV